MPKKSAPTPPYPAEFLRRLIELVRAGRSPEELAKKFEPTAQSIRNWPAPSARKLFACGVRFERFVRSGRW
jgi:hypothetical protein